MTTTKKKTPTKKAPTKKAPAKTKAKTPTKKAPSKRSPTKKPTKNRKKEILPVEPFKEVLSDLKSKKFEVVQERMFICYSPDLNEYEVKAVSLHPHMFDDGVTVAISFYVTQENIKLLPAFKARIASETQKKSWFKPVPEPVLGDIELKYLDPVGAVLLTRTFPGCRMTSAEIRNHTYDSEATATMVITYSCPGEKL